MDQFRRDDPWGTAGTGRTGGAEAPKPETNYPRGNGSGNGTAGNSGSSNGNGSGNGTAGNSGSSNGNGSGNGSAGNSGSSNGNGSGNGSAGNSGSSNGNGSGNGSAADAGSILGGADKRNAGMPDNPKNAAETVRRGGVNVANFWPSGGGQDGERGIDRQIRTMSEMMERISIESEEEREKREKRERSKKIISAVSDGLSAMSNLFFTSRYAPNMYNAANSQLGGTMASIDRAKSEREKQREQYLNYSLKLGELEHLRDKTKREQEAQAERMRMAREKADREAAEHRWKEAFQGDLAREHKGKADKAEQQAISARYEAEGAPEMQRAKLATEEARRGSYQTQSERNRAAAEASRASAAAHSGEFSAWDADGNEYKFKTEEAAAAFARQHGTWEETEERSTVQSSTDSEINGKTDKTSTTTKKGGYPKKPEKKFDIKDHKRGGTSGGETPPPLE